MQEKHVYKGIVSTQRRKASEFMSAPGVLESYRRVMGLAVIPGTLNLALTEILDLSLLDYATLADLGMPHVDSATFATMGIDFDGEPGVHWARIMIANKYPGCLCYGTWAERPGIGVELISPHHLRTVLNLKDGDTIEFTLDDVSSWGTGTK